MTAQEQAKAIAIYVNKRVDLPYLDEDQEQLLADGVMSFALGVTPDVLMIGGIPVPIEHLALSLLVKAFGLENAATVMQLFSSDQSVREQAVGALYQQVA